LAGFLTLVNCFQAFGVVENSVNDHHRLRGNFDVNSFFDVGYYPLSESGGMIYSTTSGSSGIPLPNENNLEWKNYYLHGGLDVNNQVTDYRNSYKTPSGSGFFDLGNSFNVVDSFGIYIHATSPLNGGSGIIYWRGVPGSGNNTEFQLRIGGSQCCPEKWALF